MEQTKGKIKIIFMGSAEFSVPILLDLIQNFNVLAVVTESDKPAGRDNELVKPPTKIIAENHGLPCLQPETIVKNADFLRQLLEFDPDVIIVSAYGKILPPEIINLPKQGCLNVHPSLLPRYRGASPIQTALLNGDKTSGVSIILMDQGMDTGDIIAQEEFGIEQDDNYNSLSEKLSKLSCRLLREILPKYVGNETKLKIQNDSAATYAKKINKYDGRIDWRKTAVEIYNQIRAYSDWPGSYTFYDKKKLDVMSARPLIIDSETASFGQVIQLEGKIAVLCGEGFLELQSVKLEGKKETPIADFVNGHQKFVGSLLG